jgi:hypothetical protein
MRKSVEIHGEKFDTHGTFIRDVAVSLNVVGKTAFLHVEDGSRTHRIAMRSDDLYNAIEYLLNIRALADAASAAADAAEEVLDR